MGKSRMDNNLANVSGGGTDGSGGSASESGTAAAAATTVMSEEDVTYRYRTAGSQFLSGTCFPESPEANMPKEEKTEGGRRLSAMNTNDGSGGGGSGEQGLDRELQSYLEYEEGFA